MKRKGMTQAEKARAYDELRHTASAKGYATVGQALDSLK